MSFGIYIRKGNKPLKRKKSTELQSNQALPFLEEGEVILGGAKDTAISSSKERLTANFFSYLFARFLGFFSFIDVKLNKRQLTASELWDKLSKGKDIKTISPQEPYRVHYFSMQNMDAVRESLLQLKD